MRKETRFGVLISLLLLFSGLIYGQDSCPSYSSKFNKIFQIKNTGEKVFYEFGENYYLEAYFDENCELVEIKVLPESWKSSEFSDENKTVNLSVEEYKSLLEQFNQIRSLGNFISSEKVGIVTNSKTWSRDQYQEALVDRSFTISSEKEIKEVRIISFSILYMHNVKGEISEKVKTNDSNILNRSKILLNGKWYWSNPDEFDKLRIGEKGTFQVFGLAIKD